MASSSLGLVLRFMMRYPWRVAAGLGMAAAGTGLGFVFPGVTRWFLDDIIPSGDVSRIFPAVGVALGAMALRQLFYALRTLGNNAFELRMTYDLRSCLHDKIQHLPLKWFDKQTTGDILMRMSTDVPATQRVIIEGIDQTVPALLQIVITSGVMIYLHPTLALVTMIPVPFIAAGGWIYSRWVQPRADEARESAGSLSALLHDNIAGIHQIKTYTLEPEKQHAFDKSSMAYRRQQTRLQRAWAIYGPSMGFLGDMGLLLLIGFGSYWCISREITVGQLVQFLMLLAMLYEPIGRLHTLSTSFLNGLVAAPRVFEIIHMEESEDLQSGRHLEHVTGEIRFEKVNFRYDQRRPILTDLDMLVKPQHTVAIVGATGAGKSTIFQLLTRLYEPDSGEIYLDGVPTREYSKASLRDNIGYVSQDSYMFNTTVRENLLLGKFEATDEELWEALRMASAADFVERLEGKLDAEVGERGSHLSGGERQRLSIARAFLKNAPILLLDEATSAVDAKSEKLIQSALRKLRQNRTCLIIAHRLSTIRDADQIYVLRHGQVLAHGTHEELIRSNDYYAELARISFGFSHQDQAA
ncbi:MAG TPA: ABC transporter ATP-binding protein [Candidatus Limnocylindrales bacterium]|nr:ABC transporter ATP-binding protein [Candidatus Limnocylindrales bacterium]